MTRTDPEQAGASNGGQRPSLNSGFHLRRGWPIRWATMNTQLAAISCALLGFAACVIAEEPNLPLQLKFKEAWATIEKKGYAEWEIGEFSDWSGVADGGSIAFRFSTKQGIKFDVLVANPEYWTDEDRKQNRQVIYVIEAKRFYLLEAGSTQEEHLLKMLRSKKQSLKDEGRTSKQTLEQLITTIQGRKPVPNKWPTSQRIRRR